MNLKEIKKELLKLSKQSKETYNESITEVLSGYNNKDWKKYISFDKNKYKRNYIYKSDDLEIILICWGEGQSSKIHGHPPSGGYLKVMQGNLKEYLYKAKEKKEEINILKQDQIIYEHDSIGLHKIENNSFKKAITLHIYISPGDYNPNN